MNWEVSEQYWNSPAKKCQEDIKNSLGTEVPGRNFRHASG